MTCETPPTHCPSCDARLLGFSWSEYINHLATHDDLPGRVARDMVRSEWPVEEPDSPG